MLTKKELSSLWNLYDFRPLKRLGQNFLIDKNIKDKIIKSLNIAPDDTVVEIGAGFGEMTLDLSKRSARIFAIEKDKRITGVLKNTGMLPGNVTLVEGDFLDFEFASLPGRKKVVLYGNLPYYVTSPILEKTVENISYVREAYFVIQKEVAERIMAGPGSRHVGRLSLYLQYYAEPELLFAIPRNSFYPVPEVESALLKLDILRGRRVHVSNEKFFFRVIKTAYSQRRKQLANSLLSLGMKKEALSAALEKAGVNPKRRPEELSLEEFARLSEGIAQASLN